MQANGCRKSGRGRASWRVGFAVLCAALALVLAESGASAAPTETVLHSFTGGNDGAFPEAGLIADSAGNLYGTTDSGGTVGTSGFGTVFKLAPGGTETVLHAFAGGSSDGAGPEAGLIADSAGNLYGTTINGGTSTNGPVMTNGVVFKLAPGGTETVLYSFCSLSNCSDGSDPVAGLIADSAGNLYGTTSSGGASGNCVVFKLAPGGTETVLHSFAGVPDGAVPEAGLLADSAGNLYGTTQSGGATGFGTVFKLAPPTPPATSWTETVLYSFTGGSDGAFPVPA